MPIRLILVSTVVATSMLTTACNSKHSKGTPAGQEPNQTGKNIVAADTSDPGIDLNCVYDHLQNPPESFHYLYKKDASDPVHQEADVTPQSVDGFRTQSDGTQQPIHALRTDQQGWRGALADLTGIGGMASTVAIINHNSAMRREPDGAQVNGYSTLHYSIDTARFSETEEKMLLAPGEFEKGDAWVTSTGCPVKLSLDSELHRKDGTLIEKLHYEEAMVKK